MNPENPFGVHKACMAPISLHCAYLRSLSACIVPVSKHPNSKIREIKFAVWSELIAWFFAGNRHVLHLH
jgi:hypothetical protein